MKEIRNEKYVDITKHGFERLLERTHCKRNEVQAFISKIWETGRDIESYKPNNPIRKYIANVSKRSGQERCIKVKGNALYIFTANGNAFVTCYDIPQKIIQDKKNKRSF